MPDLEAAKERIKELENQLEDACRKLEEQEDEQKQKYLRTYAQGQEDAKLGNERQVGREISTNFWWLFPVLQILEQAHSNTSRISVPELLEQLQDTQRELDNIKV